MASTAVHCISCGAQVTGTDGKAQCHSCGQEFDYTMVARAQEVLAYQRPIEAPARNLNRLCSLALTVSLFSCAFPLIAATAIGLGVAGLFRIRKTQERGVGYATAAIVISIIGSLMFLGIWRGTMGARAVACKVSCASNLRQLGQYIEMYENSYPRAQQYSFADVQRLDSTMAKDLFRCPDPDRPVQPLSSGALPSSYVMLTSLQPFRRIAKPSSVAVLFELMPHHVPAGDGFPETTDHNVLFADGHVESVKPEDLPGLIEASLNAQRKLLSGSRTSAPEDAGSAQ